jgi:aspartate dehydrogenase
MCASRVFPTHAARDTLASMDTSVGIIGFGAIGRAVVNAWRERPIRGHVLGALLVREHQREEALHCVPANVTVCTSLAEFLAHGLGLVVEVAGHAAVREHGEEILSSGVDLVLISVGSLADTALLQRLEHAASQGNSRVLLPAGAIAGLDGLLSMRQAGLSKVKYTSTKPPVSWKDTPADRAFRLDELTQSTIIFSGTAAEAARLYPKNANLAAAVALAGLGLEETLVELVADPSITENIGRIDAEGAYASLTVVVAGKSATDNPKTSQITGMSVLAALENRASLVAFA